MQEGLQSYKELASQGIMLGFPISIRERRLRPDNDVPYHCTIIYTTLREHIIEIEQIAEFIKFCSPSESTTITPATFSDRFGNIVYVIKLSCDLMTLYYHEAFRHLSSGLFDYIPHISLDKDTWEEINLSGAKTVKEAGIVFHDVTLNHGTTVVHTY